MFLFKNLLLLHIVHILLNFQKNIHVETHIQYTHMHSAKF